MAELAASLRPKKKAPVVKPEKPKKEKPPKEPKPPKPVKPPRPPKPEKPPKPPKPKKCPIIIAAALLAVLALCIAVFMPKKSAVTADTMDTQTEPASSLDPHLDELAAARAAIAGHRETTVSAANNLTVAVSSSGTVFAVGGDEYGQCDVSGWTDIVAVSASVDHTVGLKADGTAVAVGERTPGQCDVDGWAFIMLPE